MINDDASADGEARGGDSGGHSRILRGRTENSSVARLESVLTGLGRDIVKIVTPSARADGRGSVSVVYADSPPIPLAALPRDHD